MAISDYAENKILDHFLGNTAFTQPTSLTVGLFTSDAGLETNTSGSFTEVSGGSYTRATVTFGAAASGSVSNNSNVIFPSATADWGTVTHIAVFFENTDNVLFWGAIYSGKTINNGDEFVILDGQLTIALN